MATKLKSYTPKPNTGGRKPKYPWDKWFDGSPWRLRKGKDFDCTVSTMDDLARKAAAKRGHKVSVWKEGEEAVVIQVHEG